MRINKHILLYICKGIKEKGICGFLNHLLKKSRWFIHKHKFNYVGKHTYFESPFIFEGEKYISIGDNVKARQRLRIEAFSMHNGKIFQPEIIIGNNVSINYDVHIGAINKVIIDEGVLIASKVFITDHDHGRVNFENIMLPVQERMLYSKGSVHIKKNVWIGEGACILSGVTIGENSIIGANSVVTKDIPNNCISVGNPARIVKCFEGTNSI